MDDYLRSQKEWYEENLERSKDERDAIQKKTFTKWVNKHLKKSGRTVHDLFEDLQDGHNLLSLLEVLSGELLSRERGRMRFHKVQNCNAALQFLKYRKIKVVNIRPEDIVDGNPKLTLGLIWTIILHFQISVSSANANQSEQQHEELNAREARNALLVWVRDNIKGYPGVACKDFSKSWRDGLAFNALLHRYRPNLIDFRAARQRTNRENLEISFSIAEKEFGVTRLLDPEDVDTPEPDDKSIITYVSSLYDALSNSEPHLERARDTRTNAYVDQAESLHTWLTVTIGRLSGKYESSGVRETQSLLAECALYKSEEIPRKLQLKNQLSELYYELENLYINVPIIPVKEEIQPVTLEKLWRMLLSAIERREQSLYDDIRRCELLHPKAEATCRSVLIITGRLKSLREQMRQDEQRIRTLKNPYEAKNICDSYDTELRDMEVTIRTNLTDAKILRDARYYDCETIYRSVVEVEQRFISVRKFYQEGIIAQIAGKNFTSEEKYVTKRTEHISTTRLVDRREQPDDGISSDDSASLSTDGSGSYVSSASATFRNEANGAPVVQIQSYMDRPPGTTAFGQTSLLINGNQVTSSRRPTDRQVDSQKPQHETGLIHSRIPEVPPSKPNDNDSTRRRTGSLLNRDPLKDDRRLLPDDPKSDGPQSRQAPSSRYYFGASPPQLPVEAAPGEGTVVRDGEGRYSSSREAFLAGDSRRPSQEQLRRTTNQLEQGGGDYRRSSVVAGVPTVQSGMNAKTQTGTGTQSASIPTQTNGHGVTTTTTTDAEAQYVDPRTTTSTATQFVDHAALQRKARADSLKEKAGQALAQLEVFIGGLNGLEARCTELAQWISSTQLQLQEKGKPLTFSSVSSLQNAIQDNTELQKEISSKSADLQSLRKEVDEARARSKGLTAMLNEYREHMQGTPPPVYAKSNEINTLLLGTSANYDKLVSEVSTIQQNLQCLVDLFAAYQAHLDEAVQWISSHEKQVFDAEALPNDKAGIELAKMRFQELGRQTSEFQNQMDRLARICGDIQLRTENRADQVKNDHDAVTLRWNQLREACHERMRSLDSVSFFLHSCDQIHGWLLTKQKMISVLGPISYDPSLLENQKQQAEVLLEELRTQRPQINRLHDESGHLLSQTKESERISLITKLNNVEDLWTELVHHLEARIRQIENAGFASQVFMDSFQTLEAWLARISSLYESFVHVDDVFNAQRQFQELENIENELESQSYLIKNAENSAATLCEVLSNDVTASEIDSKLQNAKRQYGDLKKRNDSLKRGLEKNMKQGKEFDLACDEMTKWFSCINDRMKPDIKISALVDVLTHQVEAFDDVRQEIGKKEYEMHTLTVHGKELVTKAPADIATGIQGRLETIQSEWQDLNKRQNERHATLQNCLNQAKRYKVAVDVFLPWIGKSETVVQEFQPVSFHKEENAEQLLEIQNLRNDIRMHSADYEAVQQQGNVLVGCCEVDTETVVKEMAEVQARWDDVNAVTLKRTRSLEDVNHRLIEYEDAMAGLQDGLLKCEEKLQVADEGQVDQKTMDKLVSLQDEVESMKRQMDYVEDFGTALLADASGSDVTHIEEDLLSARNRYDDLENKISETITFLEGATVAVSRFSEYLKQTENCVNELEDELDNMAPQGKDVQTLAMQLEEVGRFEKNIDATVKEVQDADSALNDLVENGYATGADGWKEQIDGMFDQLENLMVRAQNRGSELDVAKEKLEEFHQTLATVMRSLSHEEIDDETLQMAVDGRTSQIHDQFFQRLDAMLAALNNTAEKLANCEPISALPGKLQKQIEENTRLIEDLDKRSHAYESAKRAAGELAKLANSSEEDLESVNNIKNKLSNLDDMWLTILKDTEDRGRSLEDTFKISVRFWDELSNVTALIKEFEAVLQNQDPPAVEVKVIKLQQDALQELKEELNQSQPEYAQCVTTGQELMVHCGEPDKPEVKKNIEELDYAWGNITQLFLQRDTDLVEAMEKSMSFHGLLQSLMVFLEEAEDKFSKMGSIGAETDAVKEQMEQLKEFRAEMEPHTVDVESLMAQADELIMKTSAEQAAIVNVPVDEIKQRWDMLCEDMNERQYELENALVQLGQFRHALGELVSWITEKENGLDSWTIPFGDSKIIELEMAKHKVLLNDLFANQNSIDILNEAGNHIIEASEGGEDAKATESLLDDMNNKWQELLQKADLKQTLLEERLKEAESFQDEIQDKLNWLTEKDQHLIASRPVGGLPQSAKDQLANFMELFNELDANKVVVESILKRGAEYLESAPEGTSVSLDHNLKTLKHRWDAAVNKANDRKIKLEIAVRDAVEFYDALQTFTMWLTNSEKALSGVKPPSRVMDVVLQQIEEHKIFQEDLGQHLAAQSALDKKGTTLKYFSQKQDVVQIKNLLASVQQRWDKLVSASADRQRSLNTAYTEGKEFGKHYDEMLEWIDSAEQLLDSATQVPNDAEKIRAQLVKHKEFQKQLTAKQSALNGISKMGRILKESAAKSEQATIQSLLVDLQKKWKTVGTKAAERQRKLEEALLFCGQFKDALHSMLEWLGKIEPLLSESANVHGDLDNVKVLDEQHKALEHDLSNRTANVSIVRKSARDLIASSTEPDSVMATQLEELESKWLLITDLAQNRRTKLNDALRCALEFHQLLHSLIEWLGATEMKIRVFKALPEEVKDVQMAIFEIHEYQSEMQARQPNLDAALALGNEIQSKCHPDSTATMRHWLKVLNTRWQEVDVLMKQREQRLKDHMGQLEKGVEELEQLLVWFFSGEANLVAAETEVLPEDIETTKKLVHDHQDFESELYEKQLTVERLTQPKMHSSESLQGLDKKGRKVPNSNRRPGEPQFASNSARDLYHRNKRVTTLAIERRDRLQDHLGHLMEMDKLKNFQFDDWRRKFVRFMNVKKLRVMDFFRRLDKDADGRLTRQEFIDCILNCNFQTTPLEMEIVADIFDQNKDGFVDYQEFVHALKPDWRSTQNLTDADKIEDELTFQVQNCTCKSHYQVQHVGEGRYIFGESQKLRLVRILRSTVMVRVGGGWIALDEFLVKNDPCRAKGRTNIELREQFILPEGASQSMTPFKSKSPSVLSQSSHGSNTQRPSSIGPITKIREKSVHTTPWKNGTKKQDLETSSDPTGSLSRHHPVMSHSHTHHAHLGAAIPSHLNGKAKPRASSLKPGSQPVSQHASRSPSRATSDAPEEHPSSRSSSISSMSTPSTSAKIPSGATSGKATPKLNGNPRKR